MFIVDTFCGYLSFNPNMAHYDAAYPRGVHLIIHGILWSAPAIPTAASGNIGVVSLLSVSAKRSEESKGRLLRRVLRARDGATERTGRYSQRAGEAVRLDRRQSTALHTVILVTKTGWQL
ncbi:hypothetical protein [Oceanimonas sp. GK1]|uniref:hypothetical protein n=1 Tax=Oceanimonas sp. (strain GK1 / IBRC-M 10197) TaxID=511062 RepID=UPI0011D2644A|nr:hypothetical protein [Oceanimonas sp. GK1]